MLASKLGLVLAAAGALLAFSEAAGKSQELQLADLDSLEHLRVRVEFCNS